MLSVKAAQANFITTINDGPDALDQTLFAGPIDRVLLGLKAHANTISHARLVALEETFPLTRQALGNEQFNQLSRGYVETADARACDANTIGFDFPRFLTAQLNPPSSSGEGSGVGAVSLVQPGTLHPNPSPKEEGLNASAVELASIEWAWLESYHAAEAVPLSPHDLAELDEASLLALPIALHPSARLVMTAHPLAAPLGEMAGLQPCAILTVRPEAEVRLLPFEHTEVSIFQAAQHNDATLSNLLSAAIEQSSNTNPTRPVMQLIGAGALVKRG